MKFDVRLSREAKADLIRNMMWWGEHHSPSQAVEWETTIKRQLQTLEEMPERFGFAPENDKVEFEIRQMIVGLGQRPTYRAIYSVRGAVVEVLAIRRGAQGEFEPS